MGAVDVMHSDEGGRLGIIQTLGETALTVSLLRLSEDERGSRKPRVARKKNWTVELKQKTNVFKRRHNGQTPLGRGELPATTLQEMTSSALRRSKRLHLHHHQ